MTDRATALRRILPIIIATLFFGGVILWLALRTAGTVNESQARVAAFAGLEVACEGTPVADAAPYNPGRGLHPTIAYRQAGAGWALDPAAVRTNWQPVVREQTQLVLCLGAPQSLTAPRCTAEANGEVPRRPYGEAVTARLMVAESGQLLQETTLVSAPDSGCWQADAPPTPGNLSTDLLYAWAEPFIVD